MNNFPLATTSSANRITLDDLMAYDPQAHYTAPRSRFCCPFCGDEYPKDSAHRCLDLLVQEGFYKCHRCNRKGKLGSESTFAERIWQPKPQKPKVHWAQALAKSNAKPIAGTPGERYLANRGIPAEIAARCNVRFGGSWSNRAAVLFDIRNECGETIAVQGRFLDRAQPKMITMGPKSQGVFSTPEAWKGDLTICEAPIDAISLWIMGKPAIATCGSGIPQWVAMASQERRIYIATDADEQGDRDYHEWTPLFARYGAYVERLRPRIGKDWNDELKRKEGAFK